MNDPSHDHNPSFAPRSVREQIDLLVDGELSGPEAASLRAVLAEDPELRREYEWLASIDHSIRRTFVPPAMELLLPTVLRDPVEHSPGSGPVPTIAGRIAPERRPLWGAKGLAVAALVALVAGVLFWGNAPRSSRTNFITAGDLYHKLVGRGFEPEFVCTTDKEFNAAVGKRFGQGLLLASSPEIQLVGWAYSNNYKGITISDRTLILMAKVNEQPVIVLMDRAEADRPQTLDPASGLHMHRAEAGELVLYEVSTFDQPRLIDRAYVPVAGP